VQKVTGKTLRIQSTGLGKSTVVEVSCGNSGESVVLRCHAYKRWKWRGQYRGGWLAVEFKALLKTIRNKSDEQIYGVHLHAQ